MTNDNLISEAEYQAALARGKEALAIPYAVHAHFDAVHKMLSIGYTNGLSITFDVRQNSILASHADADLCDPYVTPGGDGLLFDRAGLSFALPSVVAAALPADLARRKVAAVLGTVRSNKKAESSRANGAKGGRPRKSAVV